MVGLAFLIAFFFALIIALATAWFFLWFLPQAPVVIIYGGAFSHSWDFNVIVEHFHYKWRYAKVVVLCPHEIAN